MPSGEGNAGERWKTAKKQRWTCSALFLYISLPMLCRTTAWNFQKLFSYKFFWRKCRTCSRSLFSTAAHFHLALVAASISPFVTAATKFSCSSNKINISFAIFFLSLALDLCSPFSRWASLACRLLFRFLCLSLPLFSKFVYMTITLSLILQTTRIQNHLQDAGDYAISHQNNFELHLGCHTCRLNYFTLVYLWCGRTVVRFMVTWLPIFLGWIDFLTHGAPLRARESSAIRSV